MKLLICDTSGMFEKVPAGSVKTGSPIRCMKSALEDGFDMIVVGMSPARIRERDALIELCAVLKEGRASRPIPLAVLILRTIRP